MTRKSNVFTVDKSRTILASLTKVANDLVDVAAAAPAPSDGAGTAGPQEVVDALEVVIDEIAAISQAIPAEPSGGSLEEESYDAPVEDPSVEAPVEEEEPRLAKQVRELTARLAAKDREEIATKYAELFVEPKVQQAKYDEVLTSKDSNSIWSAKIDSIEQYKQHEGASSQQTAKASNMTSWIQPKSKFAKLAANEMMSL